MSFASIFFLVVCAFCSVLSVPAPFLQTLQIFEFKTACISSTVTGPTNLPRGYYRCVIWFVKCSSSLSSTQPIKADCHTRWACFFTPHCKQVLAQGCFFCLKWFSKFWWLSANIFLTLHKRNAHVKTFSVIYHFSWLLVCICHFFTELVFKLLLRYHFFYCERKEKLNVDDN